MSTTAVEAMSLAPPALLPARAGLAAGRSRRFLHLAMLSCLCLQRFGLDLNGSVLFVSLPAFLLLVGWMLATGQATLGTRPLLGFALFACWTVFSLELALLAPDPRTAISLASWADVLVTYFVWSVRPTKTFDTRATLEVFLLYARLCAVAGIAQFALQFAGIRWFQFTQMLPPLSPLLVETHYAFNATLAYGSPILRSNGFFLLEPSMFSQLLAIAVCVEFFVKRRFRFLPVYGLAYAVSFSGTGLLSLALALLLYGLTSARRLARVAALLAIGVVMAVVAALAMPQVFAAFAARATEFQRTGSSAHARYFGQLDVLRPFIQEARVLFGYGPGATERSLSFNLGSASPALKLVIDYGLVGLVAFSVLATAMVRRATPILAMLCLVMFQLGGGYLLFSPFVVLMTLLCAWSDRDDETNEEGGGCHETLDAKSDRSEGDFLPAV
ncbi:MAG TPA: hypothetical protein VHM31_03650 [Polyangia bacterium]|nr:hypothetical protein [Polyangia bacterium]